ncbi:MAG: CHC2 zinc finger domain-containing protein [Sedimenticola sp.]
MARIPDDQIDHLKQEVSLQRLAESQGVKLKRHGADLIGLCPFHDDKEPSLVITPKQNLWHCLGACQCGGSVIDWVMKAEGVSFRHAVELLLADYSPSLVANSGPVKQTTVRKLPTALEHSAEDAKLLHQVMDYYHETLKQSPEALAYLEKRGLANAEAIDHFKLGFANRSLGYRLPAKNRKEGAAIRGQLQRIGLLRSSGHEHFNGSIVMPVMDEAGTIAEIYGRKINDSLRKGTPKHLYLPGPHAGVWNIEALKSSPEIILCESLIDALTFWCAGHRNVTAAYGTEGFTADHLAAFKQHPIERVLIAYDRDEAGKQAADKLAQKLTAEGIDAYRIQFPKGMDTNEYALSVQPAGKSLGVAIRSAVWLGKGKAPKREAVANMKEETAAKRETVKAAGKETGKETESSTLAAATSQPLSEGAPTTPSTPLPATVLPEAPKVDIEAVIKADEVIIPIGERRYRIRGLDKNLSINQLKVNLLVTRGEALHVDTFDLYAAKSRGVFIKQAAFELTLKEEVIKRDLGKVLLKCEALQEEKIKQTLDGNERGITLDEVAEEQALSLLRSPALMQRILDDFGRCGVVGEETNKLTGYLACVSRKLDKPLAIIIQSTSAAGKSSLMDAVLNLMPEEERVQYSAMTGQSLFYMGESNLKHKILAIAEEEGAESASYALKLLQSEGELTIASTGKDESSGDLITKQYRVEGPVMLFLTTTAIDIDEELMNRCLVLTVNESREQTQAIHALQRKQQTLEGLLQSEEKKRLIQLHRNAQRLLKPLLVANPFAEQLTFIDDKTRTRRDHMKYLTLIRTIALLHQHQREIKTAHYQGHNLEYIEVTRQDIETANRLAHEVLGRTLDELPPQTCTLLKQIKTMVGDACQQQEMEQRDYRFSRREVRIYSKWSDFQIKKHMSRLQELEYVLVHRGGRGQSFVYELLYDGELNDDRHLMGLIDAGKLRYDEKKEPPECDKEPTSSPQVAVKAPPGSTAENRHKARQEKASRDTDNESVEKALFRSEKESGSYDGQEVQVSRAQGGAGATRSGIHVLAAEGGQ